MIERLCKCGNKLKAYSTLDTKCYDCKRKAAESKLQKPRKPIKQRGKETRVYNTWRDKIAKPYLDKKYGHVCSVKICDAEEGLEVDHIITRGSRHDLKLELKNVRYLCWYHHGLQTDGKLKETTK